MSELKNRNQILPEDKGSVEDSQVTKHGKNFMTI